jgi:hypothetical protein
MDIVFTVETTNGKNWEATCADPVLNVEGTDIIEVCKKMAETIEKWFVDTFNTTRKVIVEVPTIKAKIKASVVVRSEKPLTEFESTTPAEPVEVIKKGKKPKKVDPKFMLAEKTVKKVEKIIDGPCKYLSDGSGILPVGDCEAIPDDPSDPDFQGMQYDNQGSCNSDYAKCSMYESCISRIPHKNPLMPEDDDDDEPIIRDDYSVNLGDDD